MAPKAMMMARGAAQMMSSSWTEWSQSGAYSALVLEARYFQANQKVSAITGTMMSSIRLVAVMMRSPCWAAISPGGLSTMVSQPASASSADRARRGRQSSLRVFINQAIREGEKPRFLRRANCSAVTLVRPLDDLSYCDRQTYTYRLGICAIHELLQMLYEAQQELCSPRIPSFPEPISPITPP